MNPHTRFPPKLRSLREGIRPTSHIESGRSALHSSDKPVAPHRAGLASPAITISCTRTGSRRFGIGPTSARGISSMAFFPTGRQPSCNSGVSSFSAGSCGSVAPPIPSKPMATRERTRPTANRARGRNLPARPGAEASARSGQPGRRAGARGRMAGKSRGSTATPSPSLSARSFWSRSLRI